MWNELGISGGTAILILIALYYVIKWAVKNGIKEAYRAITGEKTNEDIQNETELKELGLDSEDQYICTRSRQRAAHKNPHKGDASPWNTNVLAIRSLYASTRTKRSLNRSKSLP